MHPFVSIDHPHRVEGYGDLAAELVIESNVNSAISVLKPAPANGGSKALLHHYAVSGELEDLAPVRAAAGPTRFSLNGNQTTVARVEDVVGSFNKNVAIGDEDLCLAASIGIDHLAIDPERRGS